MAVAFLNTHNTNMNTGHMQNQLTRSLERILEDANLSGELKLSGRKLKDFPKAAGKYNLSDTVFADLSRNRFCELPDDITTLAFLERLLVYHNAIRSIPDTIRGLHSLTYLDLRNNQLSVLPREICFLPLKVLLVSNNRLVSLPEELGRMEELTELDTACNQITHLPARMCDLRSLRSLTLRSNHLGYLPRELTYLQLVFLDISCNKISTLPVELRNMSSLVDLELSNNPLTSPPANLCVRGLVHVFKYLETIAAKDEKSKVIDEKGTLRRQISNKQVMFETQKNKRPHVDSGYSTSDGLDKRWSQDSHENNIAKWSPTPIHVRAENYVKPEYVAPQILSPTFNGSTSNDNHNLEEEIKKVNYAYEQMEKKATKPDLSPECETGQENIKAEEKKFLGNIQTYREYKEALRQQRSQESSIYRSKEVQAPESGSTIDSPLSNLSSFKSSPSPSTYSSNQSSPISPLHVQKLNQINANGSNNSQNLSQTSSPLMSPNRNVNLFEDTTVINSKKPVQKVIPSRNINSSTYQNQSPTHLNGNHITPTNGVSNGNGKLVSASDYAYVKPNSPMKSSCILSHNNVPSLPKSPSANGTTNKPLTATVGYVNNTKSGQKSNKTVSWNREVPAEKLSFTMRREFDKQKEETELIKQLRVILETRLKMSLPDEIGPALTDGVVLCHLANHVRERSVGSIHVPSPTVPKLTMARCRKNVDNFLDACRKIGVDEELICTVMDIVPSLESEECNENNQNCLKNPPNPTAMFRTISALLNCSAGQSKVQHNPIATSYTPSTSVTNTNSTFENKNYFQNMEVKVNNNIDEEDLEEFIIKAEPQRSVPISLDLSSSIKRKRKYASTKYSKYSHEGQKNLNEIIEECEYDSDIGKFKCRPNLDDIYDDSETSCTSVESLTFTPTNENQSDKFNDLNSPLNRISRAFNETDLNINTSDSASAGTAKIVLKRIEFFENNHSTSEKIVHFDNKVNPKSPEIECHRSQQENSNFVSTVLCLVTFVLTIAILIIYPLPN